MLILSLVIAALAVARLARLVADDEITVGFRRWVVNRFGAQGMVTRLVHCAPWCMSMWFSSLMPVAVLFPNIWVIAVLSVPAGSMLAAMILQATDNQAPGREE